MITYAIVSLCLAVFILMLVVRHIHKILIRLQEAVLQLQKSQMKALGRRLERHMNQDQIIAPVPMPDKDGLTAVPWWGTTHPDTGDPIGPQYGVNRSETTE